MIWSFRSFRSFRSSDYSFGVGNTKNGERGYWLLLLLSGVGMLWLCLLDAFTLSDDMIGLFHLPPPYFGIVFAIH